VGCWATLSGPDHASGWSFGSEPDDNVPDVVELRYAGRSGPGRRVNDGGNLYFEAFYDPQRKRIVGFQFNGIG
jgi:hypothetical protein